MVHRNALAGTFDVGRESTLAVGDLVRNMGAITLALRLAELAGGAQGSLAGGGGAVGDGDAVIAEETLQMFETEVAQPANFLVQAGLTSLLKSWGT